LVVFSYGSGKISIFAGLWLRKKNVSCRLRCVSTHKTSVKATYFLSLKGKEVFSKSK
ncbi:unnamed protein product, partial [Brassica rapa subsp. narinosa]